MFIVNLRLASAFATFFYACLVTFAHVLSTSPLFVSFTIFRTASKVKGKNVLIRSSKNLRSFLNGRFIFLIYLKIIKLLFFFLSHTHTYKFRFQLRDTFFHCLSPCSGFSFQSNPHSEDLFLILGNTGFHNRFCIWIVTSLKSTTR